jgi:hypothetical protein
VTARVFGIVERDVHLRDLHDQAVIGSLTASRPASRARASRGAPHERMAAHAHAVVLGDAVAEK